MDPHITPDSYRDVVLFLATAGVVVPLFRRWKISPILGFIGAGVALGPQGLGALASKLPWLGYFTISGSAEIAQLAEFGVVFLLFMIGLEISWERLRLMRRYVFGLGGLQVLLSTAAISSVAMTLKAPAAEAIAIGAALALSSTAVVMPILAENKRQHALAGRVTFSILLFQDLAVAPILITLGLLGRGSMADFSARDLLAVAPAALAVGGLVLFGRLFLRPMMKSVARAKSEELFVAASLLVVIGSGLIAALAGLSMALGAFIAGLLLAETEYRHEVEVTIEPFKGLLLGLFFVSLGIGLNLSLLISHPVQVLGFALGLIAMNFGVIFGLGRAFKLPWRAAVETALLLAGGGEFAFVILAAAMSARIVASDLGQLVLVSSTLSMMCIPALASLALRIGSRKSHGPAVDPAVSPPLEEGGPQVLVIGYGRVGRLVAEMLQTHSIAWLAIDSDPRLVEAARRDSGHVFYGDATRAEFLRRCGLESAPALVVTMDSPEAAESIVATARDLRPDLVIVARARDARHAKRLYDLGVSDAVPETIEASLQLSEAVLVDVGVPMGLVIASIHERRDLFRKELNRPEALGGRSRRFRGEKVARP